MPIQVTMPRLSDTMEQGTVVRWHVKEGAKISSGDLLADIETDKATMEMQAFDDGTVARLVIPEGKAVKVGETIAVLAEEGEDVASVAKAEVAKAPGTTAAAPKPAPAAAPAAVPAPHGTPAAAPATARPAAAAAPVAPVGGPAAGGSGTAGPREIVADVDAHDHGAPSRVSPVARRMAQEMGVDVAQVRGSGPNGRVIKRDIQMAAENRQAQAPARAEGARAETPARAQELMAGTTAGTVAQSVTGALVPGAQVVEVPVTGMRQTIARRLVESKTSIPHYQVTMRFGMDAILELRKQLNDQLAPMDLKLSVNDFIIRACALAMARNPYFNASWAGDRILIHQQVNIGVAIALDEEKGGGLVVGVVRDADRKSLRQISTEVKALGEKARTRGLSLEEMSGATFTISNLGMFGVDNFTAIINPPNSAILACGAAIEQPVVRDHQLTVGWEMSATLSLDHRVIDGAMAAKYLQTLKQGIETPTILLV
jgi:pyruvate dehydrogenase E2 component (dihydrolipoamide acetyltransferase)